MLTKIIMTSVIVSRGHRRWPYLFSSISNKPRYMDRFQLSMTAASKRPIPFLVQGGSATEECQRSYCKRFPPPAQRRWQVCFLFYNPPNPITLMPRIIFQQDDLTLFRPSLSRSPLPTTNRILQFLMETSRSLDFFLVSSQSRCSQVAT